MVSLVILALFNRNTSLLSKEGGKEGGGYISLFKFRMLRRYREIKEDMPLVSGEDRGQYSVCNHSAASTYVLYLLLSSSISLYLQGKRSLRKLNY